MLSKNYMICWNIFLFYCKIKILDSVTLTEAAKNINMKICFWGDIAGALTGNTSGGGELQIALLAKALARVRT